MNLLIIGGIAFGVGLIFFIWINVFGKKANFVCDLLAERSDGQLIVYGTNMGIMIVKKKGEIDKWKLIGTKIPPFQPKGTDSLYPYLKKGIDKCYLLRDRMGNIHVAEWTVEGKNIMLKPVYKDQMDFIITEQEEKAKIREKKKGWEKYEGFATIVACGMIIFLVMFFSYQYMEKSTTAIINAKDAAIKAIDVKIAESSGIIDQARSIVQRQQILDQTTNWTQTTIGG